MRPVLKLLAMGAFGGGGANWYVATTAQGAGTGESEANAFGIEDVLDGTAFNAMAEGDILNFFQTATYEIDAPIYVPKPMTIKGAGSALTIIQTDVINAELGFNTGMFYTDQSNVHFADFALDGRLTTGRPYVPSSDADFPDRSNGIQLDAACSNCSIRNVIANNMTRAGIHVRGTNIIVDNVSADNCMSATHKYGGGGTVPSETDKISLKNCTVTNIYAGYSAGKDCIELNDGIKNLTITGWETNSDNTACIPVELHDHSFLGTVHENISLINGEINDSQAGLLLTMNNVGNRNTNIIIDGLAYVNTLAIGRIFRTDGVTVRNLTAASNTQQGLYLEDCTAIVIDEGLDLTTTDTTSSTDTDFSGISLIDCDGADISAGTIAGWTGHGIYIEDSDNIVIDGNNIYRNAPFVTFQGAIGLSGTGTGCEIINNNIGNNTGTRTKHALTYVSGYDDLVFTGNTLTGLAAHNIKGDFAGTNVVVNNNVGMSAFPYAGPTGYTYIQDWLERLVELGEEIPATADCNALETFCDDLNTDGLWSRALRVWPSAIGSLGCLRVDVKNPANPLRTILLNLGTVADRAVIYAEYTGYRCDDNAGTTNGTFVNDNFKTDAYAGIETDLTVCEYASVSNTSNLDQRLSGAVTNSGGSRLETKGSTGSTRHYQASAFTFTSGNWKGHYVNTHDGTNAVIYKDGTKTTNAGAAIAPNISCDFLSIACNIATTNGGVTARNYLRATSVAMKAYFDRFDDTDEANWRTALNTFNSAVGIP